MKRGTFVVSLGCGVSAVRSFTILARAFSQPELDMYMSPHVKMAEFRGIVAIAPSGRLATLHSYGGQFDGRSRFRVASIAKAFTAVTVDRLVASGAMRFDDPLGKYLGAFERSAITIRQLLDHSSGVPDIYGMPEFARGHREPISREQYIALLASAKPNFPPGTSNAYSNSGYSLLAFAVERASNEQFAVAQKQLVLDPIGLDDTGVLPGSNIVPGFDPAAPNAVRPAEIIDPSWLIGNGSLYSTVADMLRWLAEIRAGKTVRTRTWPYPWGWGQKNKGRVLDGDGRYAGYACDALIDLQNGDAVVALSAIQSAVVNAIAGDVFASIHGGKLVPAAVRTFVPLPVNTAAEYSGVYRLSKDFAVTVRPVNDSLQLAGTDGVFESLDPLGNDRFYFRVLDTAIVFKRDATKTISAIDWGPGAFTLTRE